MVCELSYSARCSARWLYVSQLLGGRERVSFGKRRASGGLAETEEGHGRPL